MRNALDAWASLPARWKIAAALFAAFALATAVRGTHVVPDTTTYVSGAFMRPPLVFYAWNACGLLGVNVQSHLFVLVQSLSAGLAVATLGTRIVLLAGCQPRFDVLLSALLYFPQLQAAPTLSSESLAYTFFVLFVACLAHTGATGFRVGRSVVALLFAGLCYQTRPQFVFLLPVAILFVAGCAFRCREPKERARLAGGALGVAVLLLGIQAVYHLPRSGRLGGVSMAGLQLVTVVGHLATDADVESMASGRNREFALDLRRRIVANGLSADTPGRLNASWRFDAAYNILIGQIFASYNATVAHKAIPELAASTFDVPAQGTGCVGDLYCPVVEKRNPRNFIGNALGPADWVDLDRLTIQTSVQLIRSMRLRYPLFMIRMIYEHAHYWLLLTGVSLLLGAMALVSGVTVEVRRCGGMLAFCALLWLANAFLVAAVEVVQARYLFYTDSLLMVALLAILLRCMPFEMDFTRLLGRSRAGE